MEPTRLLGAGMRVPRTPLEPLPMGNGQTHGGIQLTNLEDADPLSLILRVVLEV